MRGKELEKEMRKQQDEKEEEAARFREIIN